MTTFACDMSGMTPDERQQHISTIQELFGAVQEVNELDSGYTYRLKNEDDILLRAATFIAKEQRCCPFFRFNIDLKATENHFWLSLTGPEGVKPFIGMEIGESLPEGVSVSHNSAAKKEE